MGRAEDLFKRLSDGGEEEIANLILDQQSEELFLDFKQSSDQGKGNRLHDNDRNNLAKAVSGFGNSEGGVIVWGVDCRPQTNRGDVAGSKVPIYRPKRFLSWLEGAISGCTMPPHPMVRHVAFDGSSSDTGFVVTYVAKSYLAPHQSLKHTQYFIRAGSDFVPTPHAVLAGLFGRRPQPFVFHMWTWTTPKLITQSNSTGIVAFDIDFVLASKGPGLARDLYVTMLLISPSGGTELYVQPHQDNWIPRRPDDTRTCMVSKDLLKLAPEATVSVATLKWFVKPPFQSVLFYKFIFGHEGSPVRWVEAEVKEEVLQTSYDTFIANHARQDAGDQFIKDFMVFQKSDERGPEFYGPPVYET